MKTILMIISVMLLSQLAQAEPTHLRLATTTSTENSGLLAELHPAFEKTHNVKVDVIAVGTGKAIKLAENGDVDVILVHAPAAEKRFVEAGFGVKRYPVMHNDFVIVGPENDPALINSASSAKEALQRIKLADATFISRGDDSGTHKKEKSLWEKANLTPDWKNYLAVGQGMGAVLKIANDKLAYTLTDRGTWLAYKSKVELSLLFEGDTVLFNPYHVIAVNPAKHPHTKTELVEKYIAFITGPEGQAIIQNYTVNGEELFIPDVITVEQAVKKAN